jgi:hypothetical protein
MRCKQSVRTAAMLTALSWLAAAHAVAQDVGATTPSVTPSGVTIEITPWRTDVVPLEPILIRATVSNPTASAATVAPPYMRCFDRGTLTVEVRDRRGEPVAHPQPNRESQYETGCYGGDLMSGDYRLAVPRPALHLEPGASCFAWFDVLSYYPIDLPGRYHLLFHYRSGPDWVTDPSDPDRPGEADLVSDLVIDAGWLTVRPPEGEDVHGAELVRAVREEYHQSGICAGAAATLLHAEAPGSVHARWQEAAAVTWAAPFATGNAWDTDSEAAQFAADHPSFPLNYRLGLLEACRAYVEPAHEVLAAYSDLAGGGPDGAYRAQLRPDWPDRRARLIATLPDLQAKADAALRLLRTAAQATGDYALIWAIEATVWVQEEWRRWPLGPDGYPFPP